jgi:hypothetical protein
MSNCRERNVCSDSDVVAIVPARAAWGQRRRRSNVWSAQAGGYALPDGK